MKLKELFEDRRNYDLHNDYTKIQDFLEKHSSQYFHKWIEGYAPTLYRGVSGERTKGICTTPPIRTDRRPRDSSDEFVQAFNKVIYNKFGIEQVREKSLFTSTRYSEAGNYGQIVFVFPKNGTKILYSNELIDSVYINERDLIAYSKNRNLVTKSPSNQALDNYILTDTTKINDPNIDAEVMLFDAPYYVSVNLNTFTNPDFNLLRVEREFRQWLGDQ